MSSSLDPDQDQSGSKLFAKVISSLPSPSRPQLIRCCMTKKDLFFEQTELHIGILYHGLTVLNNSLFFSGVAYLSIYFYSGDHI